MNDPLRIVVSTEGDEPELLGTFRGTDESVVIYTDTDGRYRQAPDDCVRVISVITTEG